MRTMSFAVTRLAPQTWLRWAFALGALVAAALISLPRPAAAQEPAVIELASANELADIVGPIALYPDDLVGIVLPASTYPLQVVQAARFLDDRKRNANLKPDEDWDDSVVALLNYPEVVELLNDDLDWTYDLGTAVLNQRADVLDAIQAFRTRAYAAGNLRTDERQTVARDNGAIAITPADPKVIYVPYYEPERVVVYQPVPVYHYHPWRYPVYYYPYPAGYVFDTGFWGVRSWFSVGWHSHFVHVYDYGYRLHPYYGFSYYDPWYVRNVYVNVNVGNGYAWEPRYRYGGRPVVRGYEGRVYTSRDAPQGNRGAAGSTYRTRSSEGRAGTDSSSAGRTGTEPRRGVADSAYRDRTLANSTPTAPSAPRTRPTRGVMESTQDGGGSATASEPRVYRSAPQTRPATPDDGARPGRGMAQASERYRTAPADGARTREVSPRAMGGSSGMPREAPRSFEPRSMPAPSRGPDMGGGNPAPRSDGGGSYRGGGGDGGGSYRGGGQEHPATRGGEGRSAAR